MVGCFFLGGGDYIHGYTSTELDNPHMFLFFKLTFEVSY